MGIPVNRIEREFILKSLKEGRVSLSVLGNKWELQSRLIQYNNMELQCEILHGDTKLCREKDDVEVFFSLQNNHFTFNTQIRSRTGNLLFLLQPEELYKDANRGYRRVKVYEETNISILLKQQQLKLNFPRTSVKYPGAIPVLSDDFDQSSISRLLQSFKEKMIQSVSEHRIQIMRDRLPENYEEQLMVETGKIIWIPSTEKDIPAIAPFPRDLVLTKDDFIKYEEAQNIPDYNREKRIKNFIFQKKIKGIHSEVYCPVFYLNYFVGYIYVCNKDDLKREISRELIEYIDQFSRVLSHSLKENGYFKTKTDVVEATYNAPVIDISASGLLFSHTSYELEKELDIFKELSVNFTINGKKLHLDSWVIRKFKDKNRFYFGIQFRKINPDDFCYLYERLYNKPFQPQGKYIW
ncbi:MAG: PilZ domain-containing protein [Spirochaetales bacterium]|nr:PilZ domain-containing protein [Spirochaetales bacterium]